ncbi:MAG: hypothetical protein AAF600_18475 [Bacteroidota bacterium]
MYSHEIFADFPKGLPNDSLKKFEKDYSVLMDVQKQISNVEFNLLTPEQYEKSGISREFHRFLQNVSILQEKDLRSIDFEQTLYHQEYISLFSYLEGFFQDIQRLLFDHDNQLLTNEHKEIPLNEILEAGSYEKLISSIIDSKLEKSGYEKNFFNY